MKAKRTKAERELIRQAMSLIGRASTPAKRAAARDNGKLGGRPKKKA